MRIRLIHRYFVLLLLLVFTGCATRESVVSPQKDDLSSKIVVQDINPEAPLEQPVQPELSVSKPIARVTSYRLNLRENGSAKSRILGVLKKGDVLEILSEKGKWVQVNKETGLSGWVYGRYIEPIDGVSIAKVKDVKKQTKRLKSRQKKEMKSKMNRSATPAKAAGSHKTEKAGKPSAEKQTRSDQNKKATEKDRKIPSHFDHHGVFLMLAQEYCIDKWRYFNGIGYLDNSWKNKDPRKRMINFNCRVVENNEWRDNHLKFTYEYNKPKGWHIIEVFDLNADARNGKQSGIIDQIKVPSEGTKKAPTKPEEMIFSNQVVDRFFINILGGDIEAVKGFIDAGMSPNVKRPRLGHSPLFTSVIGHRDKIALLLIKKGAEVNFRDEDQSTPLMWAAENCKAVPLVKALINAGAYVNARAKGGGTPLMGAEDNHCEEIVRILKEAGAN